jgi:hypothetical protein
MEDKAQFPDFWFGAFVRIRAFLAGSIHEQM